MVNQIALLFDKDGSGSVFAGTVSKTRYDTDTQEVIIRTKKLITFATLERAFDNHKLEFGEALLSTAANQSLEISYYKKEIRNAQYRESSLKTKLDVCERHNEILERQLNNVTI